MSDIWFSKELQQSLKEQFYYADKDPDFGERLFLDNSGGSLRLKRCVAAKMELEAYPDCPERDHNRALELQQVVQKGTEDILQVMFGAKSGALITELTASQTMFHMVELIMEHVPGTNAAVSALEHPSAFDAVAYFCRKTGKELRVIPADPETGEIRAETVAEYVDENTCLLSVMSASNITGSIMDMEAIVAAARAKKPDMFIISDAVQHAPHCIMDVEKLGLDGMNFAPYKFFGVRGCGFAYVSDRVARLPHRKLLAKDETVFALGTSTPGNFAACEEIISYVAEIGAHFTDATDRKSLYKEGMKQIHLQERSLLVRMLEGTEEVRGLRHIPGVTVFADKGDITKRDLIAAIAIDGLSVKECTERYQARGITVCGREITSMYSERILNALQCPGAVRVSPLHCNGAEDIDRFLKITAEIAEEAKL